jgi:DNA-directed RNA polymerase specialized sigma24 family protein
VTRLAIRRYHQRARRPFPSGTVRGPQVSVEGLPLQWEAALPEQFWRVMFLSCREELPYEEISHRLQIPIGTVRSRLFRGRRLLRAALSGMSPLA